jgi:hypothetical protein
MNLATWTLRHHPFFLGLTEKLNNRLVIRSGLSIDDLVVELRRPLRPILLVLDILSQDGLLSASTFGSVRSSRFSIETGSDEDLLRARYGAATAKPGDLALLWTQRRLTRASAADRANYVARFCVRRTGRIVLFGDDDLVSPLLAAKLPDWHVTAIDIDADVLQRIDSVAKQLGSTVDTIHADLATWRLIGEPPDIVVCDPFPTKDGSFERIFWVPAASILRAGGMLVSTSLPSHKPTNYSADIAGLLRRLDFSIVDQRMSGGTYEVYDFDLLPQERAILQRLKLHCTVHHTKALFAAEKLTDRAPPSDLRVEEDVMKQWMRRFSGHYLTVAAGKDVQAQLSIRRSPQSSGKVEGTAAGTHAPSGMDVSLLLPSQFEARTAGIQCALDIEALFEMLELKTRLRVEANERALLLQLHMGTFDPESLDEPLALVVRSLDSWTR